MRCSVVILVDLGYLRQGCQEYFLGICFAIGHGRPSEYCTNGTSSA